MLKQSLTSVDDGTLLELSKCVEMGTSLVIGGCAGAVSGASVLLKELKE